MNVIWKKKTKKRMRQISEADRVCVCEHQWMRETYVLLLLYWAAVSLTHWVMHLTMASSDWPGTVSCLAHPLAAVWFPVCSVCSCPAGLSQKRPPAREDIGVKSMLVFTIKCARFIWVLENYWFHKSSFNHPVRCFEWWMVMELFREQGIEYIGV